MTEGIPMELTQELLATIEAAPQSEAEAELRDWLKTNKERLANRDAYEISSLAITCGFEASVVYQVVSSINDVRTATALEDRARLKAFRFSYALHEIKTMQEALDRKAAEDKRIKELDLMPLWKDVHFYQTNEDPK